MGRKVIAAQEPVIEVTTPKNEWAVAYDDQATLIAFNELSMTAQNNLWSALQDNESEFGFIPAVKPDERPKTVTLRHKDATNTPKRMAGQLWCSYCGTWRTYRNHHGYDRCIACGISTMDFYVRSDNHMWGEGAKDRKLMAALSKRKAQEEEEDDAE